MPIPSEISLFVALYIDEDITNRLAALLRERGYRAMSAIDSGMMERSDEEHLIYATAREMAVLTCNEDDFIALARRWDVEGRSHSGILISEQFSLRQTGEFLRRLLRFLDSVTADEMVNVVRYLSDFK